VDTGRLELVVGAKIAANVGNGLQAKVMNSHASFVN
jgi:hypothetical protein